MADFEYIFPSIRGVQAGREYFVSMCPLRLIPRIFLFDEEELKPELRAQRTLNRQRIPEMTRYLLQNPKGYTFSSLTASIDGKVKFDPLGQENSERNIGSLRVSMNARFVINDGQHRRAAIEAAMHENPSLGDETVSVVFFVDIGLKRCQQMFSDLNRHAVHPTPSLGILYDHRSESAQLAKQIMDRVPVFNGLTETERSAISNRSMKLFTLSGIYSATQSFLRGLEVDSYQKKLDLSIEFWIEVTKYVADWHLARERKVTAADLRRDYLHSHTLALAAIARVGNALMLHHHDNWRDILGKMRNVDWSRNSTHWEGRATNAGRISKKGVNVTLTCNFLKIHMGIPLSEEEQELETQLRGPNHG